MLDWLVVIAEQSVALFGLAVLLLLLVALEVGYLAGKYIKQIGWVQKETNMSSGIIVGGMMTFMAFFLGISLSIGFAGFQMRQAVIVSEANAIDSAWLFAGTQANNTGADIQLILEDYTKIRLSAAGGTQTSEERLRLVERTRELQKEIWAIASDIEVQAPNRASALLLVAITEVINTSFEQRQAFNMRVPTQIGKLLVVTAALALLSIGLHLGMLGKRMAIMSSILVVTIVSAVALISDLSRPYHGGLNVSPAALQWTLDDITKG